MRLIEISPAAVLMLDLVRRDYARNRKTGQPRPKLQVDKRRVEMTPFQKVLSSAIERVK